ncbi:unnamed protein product, partial [Effrenium voratum]
EQLAAVRAAAPGSARPAPQAPHPTPRPRRRPVEPIYPLVVPEEAEKACEGALLELCGRHLDGQNPQLKELLVACRHGIENEKQLEQLLPEVKITRARDARAARDVGDLDAGTCANNRNASELNSTEDVPAFFSGIRCEGVCSSGLALAAVKAALQQSLQLLLDGALLLLNHGLGADPDKGRAAAAKAAGIGRALRAQLAARAVQRWDELAQGEVKKVLTRSGAALQRWGAAWALRLSSAWARLLGNLPPERRTWLPQDRASLEDLGLLAAWLLVLLLLCCKAMILATKFAFHCVTLPCRLARASCRCCMRRASHGPSHATSVSRNGRNGDSSKKDAPSGMEKWPDRFGEV